MTKDKLKAQIHKLVDAEDDINVLKSYKEAMRQNSKQKGDFWNDLNEDEKFSIKKAVKQLENGEGFSDEEVQKEIRSRFNLK